jgi:hypothetical protein
MGDSACLRCVSEMSFLGAVQKRATSASPVPLAVAEAPEPLLLAVAVPSGDPFGEAVLPVVSTEPFESAPTLTEPNAKPPPTDVATHPAPTLRMAGHRTQKAK